MTSPVCEVVNPPCARAMRAALDAAATTLGSSVAIGTSRSSPSTVKFVATPTGIAEHADDVLDHVVGLLDAQPGVGSQGVEGRRVESGRVPRRGRAARPGCGRADRRDGY